MWQYSSTGRVKGISTAVDLDYDLRDYTKIIRPRTQPGTAEKETPGWHKDDSGIWYVKADGSRVIGTKMTIDGKTYYFDSSGYRTSGWQKIGKYYYYFSYQTGAMRKTSGWFQINGNTYYLNKTGARQTGWLKVGGDTYYLNAAGVKQTGWLKLNGRKYFLKLKTGKLHKGWLKYQGKTFYFAQQDGRMRTGWLTFGTKKYYIAKNGNRAAGWTQIRGKWYYFNKKDGVMKRSCKVGKYIFDADGVCWNYK